MFKVSNRSNRWKRCVICYFTRFSILSIVTFELKIFGDYIFTKIVFVFSFCIEFFHLIGATHQQCIDPFYFSVTINPFFPNAPFLYPENIRVEKGCIENEWVNGNTEIKWVNALLMCCSKRFSDFFKVKRKGAFGNK